MPLVLGPLLDQHRAFTREHCLALCVRYLPDVRRALVASVDALDGDSADVVRASLAALPAESEAP